MQATSSYVLITIEIESRLMALPTLVVIEEDDFDTYHISHSEGNRIPAVIWDTESGLMFSPPS
jgi:hypothetical protein